MLSRAQMIEKFGRITVKQLEARNYDFSLYVSTKAFVRFEARMSIQVGKNDGDEVTLYAYINQPIDLVETLELEELDWSKPDGYSFEE